MYSEFDVKRQIEVIESGEESPVRKARRLISLSRSIGKFSQRLNHGEGILRSDDDEDGAQRLHSTLDSMKRLQEEARLAAFRALKADDQNHALTFGTQPAGEAYPHWIEGGEPRPISLA